MKAPSPHISIPWLHNYGNWKLICKLNFKNLLAISIYFILCWINQHAFAHTGNVQLLELFQQLKKNQTTSMYNIGFYEKPFNEYTRLCMYLFTVEIWVHLKNHHHRINDKYHYIVVCNTIDIKPNTSNGLGRPSFCVKKKKLTQVIKIHLRSYL